MFAVVAVGGEAGLGEHADERGGGDEVEPVAEEADDLAEPEVAEVAVVVEQVGVADGGLGGGIGGHSGFQVIFPCCAAP